MYNWVVNTIGTLPLGSEWIYSIATIILYGAFITMLCSPIIIIMSIIKKNKRRNNRI